MKKLYVEIRNIDDIKIRRTYKFSGDTSVLIMGDIVIITEHELDHKETKLMMNSNERACIRNWGD